MTEENKLPDLDYKTLGLKCGLEIHQQLNTKKLFCQCNSMLREDVPDYIIERKLRPVASELSEFDAAALQEFKKNRVYKYHGYYDSICLVELDEEPPHNINQQALNIAFEVSNLCKTKIVDEIYTMRKAVIDGSNTSGFQRTMMVSTDGFIDTKEGPIGVQTVALEEDSCRPKERTSKHIIYNLDRLGIPLIELATDPDMFTPEQVKEVAFKIGTIMRITCKAMRGLGTIRQDVNISIKEGARVEIKGVQDLAIMDEYVKREVYRQKALIEVREELQKRKLSPEDFTPTFTNITKTLESCESKVLQSGLKNKGIILAVKLKGLKGLLGKETQPGRRFGSELADYAKVKAGVKGIFHSDELPKYGIEQEHIEKIKQTLSCQENDAFALVVAQKAQAETALEAAVDRVKVAFEGVPEETRNPLDNGNSSYNRPLPGKARMYPETDVPTYLVSKVELEKISQNLPLYPEERVELYQKEFGLNKELAEKLKLSNYARFFEDLSRQGIDSKALAVLLTETLVELKRKDNLKTELLSNDMIKDIMFALKEDKFQKEMIPDVIKAWLKTPALPLSTLLTKLDFKVASTDEIEEAIDYILSKNEDLIKQRGLGAIGALMGDAMKELKGKASGQQISAVLKKKIEEKTK